MAMSDRAKERVLILVVLVLMASACEMAVRLLRPQITFSKLLNRLGSYYAPDPDTTFTLQRNYLGTEPSMEHPGQSVQVTINAQAMRGQPPRPGADTVMVVGDSYTFGVYVNDDETYPAVLERLAAPRNPDLQVLNAGYTAGFETDQQFAWLRRHLDAYRPRVVILGIFAGNDILGIKPKAWREPDERGLPGRWIDRELMVTEAGFIINKVSSLGTVGAELIYHVPILRESHFAVMVGHLVDRLFFARPVASNRQWSEHLFGRFSAEFERKESIFVDLVAAMRDDCEGKGVRFVAALLPVNFMVEPEKLRLVFPNVDTSREQLPSTYHARLAAKLRARGVEPIDVEAAMRASTQGPFFPANGEVHFNPNGNRFTAQTIEKVLVERGLLR